MCLALLWKEWREQRWKVAMGSMLIATLMGGLSWSRLLPAQMLTTAVLAAASVILPILATIDVLVVERKNGTLHHLAALPFSPRLLCMMKCVVGLATVLIPMLVGLLVVAFLGMVRPEDQIEAWLYGDETAGAAIPPLSSIIALFGAATMWYVAAFGISTDRPHEGEVFITYAEIAVVAGLGFFAFVSAQMDVSNGGLDLPLVAKVAGLAVGLVNPAVAYLAIGEFGWERHAAISFTVWWPVYVVGQLVLAAAMLKLGTHRFLRKL
jgi:hypothetical protein